MTEAVVYSRRGCHLCEDMLEALVPVLRGKARLTVVDIDTDPELRERYDTDIPVLTIADQFVCRYTLDTAALADALAAPNQT